MLDMASTLAVRTIYRSSARRNIAYEVSDWNAGRENPYDLATVILVAGREVDYYPSEPTRSSPVSKCEVRGSPS